jgi:hypothetical protein
VILSEPRVSQRFLQTLPCWDQGRDACTWGHTQFTAGIDTLLSVTACLLSQRQCPVFIDLFLCHPCQGQASHTWTQPWLVPGAPGSPRRWVWSLTTASSLAVWGPWWPWSVPGQWGIWPVLHGVNMPAYVCVCVRPVGTPLWRTVQWLGGHHLQEAICIPALQAKSLSPTTAPPSPSLTHFCPSWKWR